MSLENSSKASEQAVNQREQYKRQKLEQTNQIFFCECGKNYLTFSALYLHARNKHNVKLTTKKNSANCKVQTKGRQTIITYFTLQKTSFPSSVQNQQQKKSSHSNQISPNRKNKTLRHLPLLSHYIQQQSSTLTESELEVLRHFLAYFQTIRDKEVKENYDPEADITLFFNEFTIFYIPKYEPGRRRLTPQTKLVEDTLIKFYHWLRRQNLTSCKLAYKGEPIRIFSQ